MIKYVIFIMLRLMCKMQLDLDWMYTLIIIVYFVAVLAKQKIGDVIFFLNQGKFPISLFPLCEVYTPVLIDITLGKECLI